MKGYIRQRRKLTPPTSLGHVSKNPVCSMKTEGESQKKAYRSSDSGSVFLGKDRPEEKTEEGTCRDRESRGHHHRTLHVVSVAVTSHCLPPFQDLTPRL